MAKITLTIDNGPHREVTPAVLEVLAERNVCASFFVVGGQVARPGGLDLLARIRDAGHTVGNHTWSHEIPFGENADPGAVEQEVARTTELIAPFMTELLFRPFGGGGRLDASLFSPALIEHLCDNRYTCALWNNVPRDWEDLRGWVETALRTVEAQPWSVVVVHDIVARNHLEIARFIDAARAAGHEFVAELAPSCLPIVAGEIVHDLAPLTSHAA